MKYIFALVLLMPVLANAQVTIVESCDSDFHSLFGIMKEKLTVNQSAGFTAEIIRTLEDGKTVTFNFGQGTLRELTPVELQKAGFKEAFEYNLDLFSRRSKRPLAPSDVSNYRVYTLTSDDGQFELSITAIRNHAGKLMYAEYGYKGSPGIYGLCK